MNVQQLRDFYEVNNNSQLAKKIKKGRSTIHGWESQGIPAGVQATFEILTGGKLKANRRSLSA